MFESVRRRARELETEIYALSLAARDSRTPIRAKGVILLVVGYAASPVDLIPDFVPGLGYLDDLLVLPVGIAVAVWLIPDEILIECRQRADEELDVGRARWIVAGVVVAIWIVVGLWAITTFGIGR